VAASMRQYSGIVEMMDLALLTTPVPGDDPCGPDLDAEGDSEYLNFFASVDAVFPTSFFEVRDEEGNVKRFDPKAYDLDAKIEAAKAFLARTSDLRLIVLIAKLSILRKDLQGFTVCIEAIAELLDQRWDGVHPRANDDNLAYRQMAIEALDVMPTVVIPIQFLPLAESRRLGSVSYRTWLIAKGEVAPRADDTFVDSNAVTQVFDQIDLDQLKALTAGYVALVALVERVCRLWNEKAESSGMLNLDRVVQILAGIVSLLEGVIRRRDPAALIEAVQETGEDAGGGTEDSAPAFAGSRVASTAAAAAALGGIAAYFARVEPSSPALLLVRQAEHLLGKSFAEAIHMLVPNHAETATINIGRGWFFDVSVDRMAALLDAAGTGKPVSPEGPEPVVYSVNNRSQALGLLEQVATFFRNVEPSSPVPFLADRARELAQRDFLSLLVDVLPSGSLRGPDNQT
jgi:type VI secretion system protein ImpA